MRGKSVVSAVVALWSVFLFNGAAPGDAGVTAQPSSGVRMRAHGNPPIDKLGVLPAHLGIRVGQKAPAFSVQDVDGKSVQLASFLGKGLVLLVFYRGGWCPFCNFQLHELAGAVAEFKQRNVQIVAVSVDRPKGAEATREAHNAPFPVLSDPDLVAHRAFHVVHHVGDEEFGGLKGYGMDIEKASGRTHHDIAVPSLFVLDRAGTVRWAHADEDYKVRPSVAQLLAALDALPRAER